MLENANGPSKESGSASTSGSEKEAAEDKNLGARMDDHVADGGGAEVPVRSNGAEAVETDDACPPRPMSPGTLALMCDEQDTLFTAPPSPSGGFYSSRMSYDARLYAEQERVILCEFRDCLRRVMTVGKRKGSY